VFPPTQRLSSAPGALYWTPWILRADEYSVAEAGVAVATRVATARPTTISVFLIRQRKFVTS
jgi:hypothetical protein